MARTRNFGSPSARAKRKGRPTFPCVEYELTEEQALQWLIQTHHLGQGLGDFVRIEMALDLEPYFRRKAQLNEKAGGQYKGLSKLTTAEKINSRSEIARVANVSVGNVHKVKFILAHACPIANLIASRAFLSRPFNTTSGRDQIDICISYTSRSVYRRQIVEPCGPCQQDGDGLYVFMLVAAIVAGVAMWFSKSVRVELILAVLALIAWEPHGPHS